jgi:hypothetical protein
VAVIATDRVREIKRTSGKLMSCADRSQGIIRECDGVRLKEQMQRYARILLDLVSV